VQELFIVCEREHLTVSISASKTTVKKMPFFGGDRDYRIVSNGDLKD